MTTFTYQSLWMNDELGIFRKMVRQFMQEKFVPHCDLWSQPHRPDGEDWKEVLPSLTEEYVGEGDMTKDFCTSRSDRESLYRLSLSKRLFIALPLLLLAAVTTFAQSTISVSVSPQRDGLTVGQTLSFTATVTNDIGAAGVSWTVPAGGTLNGQTTTTASFSSSSAGVYTITATSIADHTKSASATIGVTDLAGVFTYHNDLSRDGSNPSEYALTTSNVTAATFGKLFSCTVDETIYTQPLWVANLTINGARHNVVFVATQHEGLYAFDADVSPCVTLWHVNLIDTNHGGTAGETSVPSGPTGNLVGAGYGDITPEVGVTGTPVIDPLTNTLYVVTKSVITSGPTFFQRLHGINALTGSERTGSPVNIAGTYPGTGDGSTTTTFVTRQQNQRAALALVNGVVYISWSSHEDHAPYYGWVMGYNAASLTQTAELNVTPNVGYGGIWMGGGAPAADTSNNLYLITGNGTFDANSSTAPKNDYGDSFLKLTSTLSVSQYFTPSDQSNDNAGDQDFGSGGAAILVDQPTSPVAHLVIGGGKDGYLYLMNRDAMGGLGDSNAWQRFYSGSSIFATGAFWNGRYYLAGVNDHLQSYSFTTVTGKFDLSSVPRSPGTFGFPGSTPSVSSSGTANGIVWALNNGNYCTPQSTGCGPTVLHAYDATNVETELWNSTQGAGNAAGNAVKFAVPTVANGKVYVGTRGNNTGGATSSTTIPGELDVYGLLISALTSPFSTILVHAGGAAYTDSQAQVWSADKNFAGGFPSSTTQPIANTTDPSLYQTERFGNFTYQFTVPNGSYNVTLKFAEIYWNSAGKRIFNVVINGTPVLSNFDIVAAVGAPFTAIDKTFSVATSTGAIMIQFTSGSADLPKVSAIEISSGSGVSVQVNPTTASLHASQQQQFTASVTGNANTAVNWTYNPQIGTLTANGLYTAPASVTAAQTVSVTATSQVDTTKSAFATVNLLPPAFTPIFVHSGGGVYTDSLKNSWSADTGFIGGNAANTTSNIVNTPDPKLYQTERYGNFSYMFTVPNGSYNVVLKFAEIYWTKTGQRIFNVFINGTQVLTNFDIVAAAGAALTAIDKTFPATVTNGQITIQFTSGSVDLPKVSAIEIH